MVIRLFVDSTQAKEVPGNKDKKEIAGIRL
jgi:hypothetical protein